MKKKITIKEISELCNVSRQTISRVLNNSDQVKENTRKKVLEVIKKYNYKPNIYAQKLAGGNRNKNILLSIKADLSTSASIWLNLLVNNIISSNKNKNITIITEQYYDEEDYKNSILNTTSEFIDGVVIFYEEKNDERIKLLKNLNIPYIIYGRPYNEEDICVGIDNEQSVKIATEYFFDKNIDEITFISAFPNPVNLLREKSIYEIYKEKNKNLEKLKIIKNIINQKEIYDYVKETYINKNLPKVLFVSGDEKAIAALYALNELNIKVPEDVSVIGIDDIPMSKYFIPSLSTISYDYGLIAKTVLEKILNIMDGKLEKSEYIKGKLVIRGSTI